MAKGSRQDHAAARKGPFEDVGNADNDFNVFKFTAELAHRADPVPDRLAGKYVRIYNAGPGVLHYAFTLDATAEVDRAVAASNAGASVKVGDVVPAGASEEVLVPDFLATAPAQFVREADQASTVIYMSLKDEGPGTQ